RDADTQEIYVDGVNKTYIYHIDPGVGDVNPSTNVYMGADVESGGYYFNGTIDEVMIFNRSLSQEEITALYNGTKTYHNFTNLADGSYEYCAHAIDSAGNTNQTETRTLTVDTAPQNSTFNISLDSGWNLISIPLELDNWTLTSVLAQIEGKYNVVFVYLGGWKKSTSTRVPLTEMSREYGYWINMSEPATLTVSGTVPSVTTMNVIEGWNLMGFPSLTVQNLTIVLSPISYNVVFEYRGGWKKSTSTRVPLTDMSPGYGYWINATADGSYNVSN
ncbi:MAG: LamG-like jellyroll fold domain-containing protein, partial [Candidatus Hydrothermarchaeaceae archaeon]